MDGQIRVIAICLFSKGDGILVAEGFDTSKGSPFYRPLGGGVEFGETTQVTVIREIREELGHEIKDLRLVGTLENLFELEGIRGHQIVFVYDGEFINPGVYEHDQLKFKEDSGKTVTARWRPLDFFDAYHRLVPEQLHQLLGNGDDASSGR
jgi:8-oxo-dGTP pyrophosphatase MutT (NUDIX family)